MITTMHIPVKGMAFVKVYKGVHEYMRDSCTSVTGEKIRSTQPHSLYADHIRMSLEWGNACWIARRVFANCSF
jgi:hypothetical protein